VDRWTDFFTIARKNIFYFGPNYLSGQNFLSWNIISLMMIIIFIFGISGFLSLCHGQQSLQTCSSNQEKETERCLSPMINYATSMQSQTILPLEGHKTFETMCRLYADFHGCIFGLNCQSQSIEAIEASYGYMCGDAYSEFANYVECFVQVESSHDYKQCKTEATSSLSSLQFDTSNTAIYFDRLCKIMRHYMMCSKDSIFHFCDSNAWQLVARVTRDSLKITMPKCELEDILKV